MSFYPVVYVVVLHEKPIAAFVEEAAAKAEVDALAGELGFAANVDLIHYIAVPVRHGGPIESARL